MRSGLARDEATGEFIGSIIHVDLDEKSQSYSDNNELRYKRYVEGPDKYFLDVGSGGRPRAELASGFEFHVCVDVSIRGLQEAREVLQDNGLYILADMSALPFKENVFGGALACHCLYHVAKDLQVPVVRELYRVMKVRASILIFYSSRYNLISFVHAFPKFGIWLINKMLYPFNLELHLVHPWLRRREDQQHHGIRASLPLYSYPHNPRYIAKSFKNNDVTCLAILTNYDTGFLNKLRLFRIVVPWVSWLERKAPHLMSYVGKYTCIKIYKDT